MADRRAAAARYAALVDEVSDAGLWQQGLRQQVFLGDETFVARMLAQASSRSLEAREVPRPQRRVPSPPKLDFAGEGIERAAAMRTAYVDGGLTMTEIARRSGLSVSRVSRLIASVEVARGKT